MISFGLSSASILAQINTGNSLLINLLAIFMAFGGVGLYFLRNVRPALARDQDIFFAAVGIAYGCIIFFQGWRLDPILQFSQFILAGSAAFFVFDSVRLRGIETETAIKKTPIVDDNREVSDRYEYEARRDRRSRSYGAERVEVELEPLPYYDDEYEDEPPIRGRIPSSRDNRPRGSSYDNDYDYDYDDQAPRRPSRRSSNRNIREERPRTKTTSRRSANRTPDSYTQDDWNESSSAIERADRVDVDDWDSQEREERRPSRPTRNRPSVPHNASLEETRDETSYTKLRKRPNDRYNEKLNSQPKEDDVIPTTYVDYKPLDSSEDDSDESINPQSYGEY
ncbi:MAG: Ycf66 family protein [Cyanobacteria bacterium P01_A01_bin.84]